MRLLLDTHAFLWFVMDDPRLGGHARVLIEDAANERLLSVASCWEIAIKLSLGRLGLAEPLEVFLRDQMARNAIAPLPVEIAHTVLVSSLPFHHRDPFDRLLVAQALVERVPLLSADATLDAYEVDRRW